MQKLKKRTSALTKFKYNYDFDPEPLLHLDWMSDEDSEPEDYAKCETEGSRKTDLEGRYAYSAGI